MSRGNVARETPTRKNNIRRGETLAGAGLLTGFTGGDAQQEPNESSEPSETGQDSYTVEMAPVGEATDDNELFDRVRVGDIVNGEV